MNQFVQKFAIHWPRPQQNITNIKSWKTTFLYFFFAHIFPVENLHSFSFFSLWVADPVPVLFFSDPDTAGIDMRDRNKKTTTNYCWKFQNNFLTKLYLNLLSLLVSFNVGSVPEPFENFGSRQKGTDPHCAGSYLHGTITRRVWLAHHVTRTGKLECVLQHTDQRQLGLTTVLLEGLQPGAQHLLPLLQPLHLLPLWSGDIFVHLEVSV